MRLVGTLDALLGRALLPSPDAAPVTPTASQLWMLVNQLFFRATDDSATLRLLTDADRGVANGVASLDSSGMVPTAQLPTAATSVVGISIGGGMDWYGDPSSIPSGFLVRDGAEYLREDYPSLAAILRGRYGRPTNDLYFRVPDSIGRLAYGAWSFENSGYVRRVDIFTRGQGYTPGSYTFTFTGGTFSSAATGRVVIGNETVPDVGTTGVVQRVEILTPGAYTSTGATSTGTAANCALTIPISALPGGSGFVYDVLAQPLAASREPYAAYSVKMTAHGTAYTTPPEVVISGATLIGATGYAIVRDGGVANIVLSCRGTGSIAGATVTITGGGGTGATAVLRSETRYLLTGDYVGEEQHFPLEAEIAAHRHKLVSYSNMVNSGSEAAAIGDDQLSPVPALDRLTLTGDDYPTPVLPAGLGSVPLIRAV